MPCSHEREFVVPVRKSRTHVRGYKEGLQNHPTAGPLSIAFFLFSRNDAVEIPVLNHFPLLLAAGFSRFSYSYSCSFSRSQRAREWVRVWERAEDEL